VRQELSEPLRATPMRLLRIPEPFDSPDFIFEPKLDGFRALAHIRGHRCEPRRSTADTSRDLLMHDFDWARSPARTSSCSFRNLPDAGWGLPAAHRGRSWRRGG
jgi:hypothetical protein